MVKTGYLTKFLIVHCHTGLLSVIFHLIVGTTLLLTSADQPVSVVVYEGC